MKTEEERLRDIEIADVRRIMNKREGRRFFWRLLTMSKVLTVPGPCDAAIANFANGQRVMGTTLWGEVMESCPEQFTLMQVEARQDKAESDLRRSNEARDTDDRRDDSNGD